MRRMKRKRMRMVMMMLSRERLPKMRTMRRWRTMRMSPNLSTPTPSLPNFAGSSRPAGSTRQTRVLLKERDII